MAYRTSVHDTTGETPAMMMMGRDLSLPVDLFIGRPEDEPPVQKSDYAQNLLNRLGKVHEYARQHLKLKKTCSTVWERCMSMLDNTLN